VGSESLYGQVVRMVYPYAFCALGGLVSERAGVMHVGLEGILLGSALAAAVGSLALGSAWAGLAAGVTLGALFGVIHAELCAKRNVNPILSGLAINLLALGGTRSVLRGFYHSSANSPSIAGFSWLRDSHSALGATLLDPLFWLLLLVALALPWGFARTRFGLAVRGVGEAPQAAEVLGLQVPQIRYRAIVLGSAIAGLGGVALAFDAKQFQSQMSAGKGFIALIAVLIGRMLPGRVLVACVLFAVLDALQVVFQGRPGIPTELYASLPYLAALLALAIAGMRRGTQHTDG
jgi:general nucleoside transport system permease protein